MLVNSSKVQLVKQVGRTILACSSSQRLASATQAISFLQSAQFWEALEGKRSGCIVPNPNTPCCLSTAFAAATADSAINRLSCSSISYYAQVLSCQHTLQLQSRISPTRSANVELRDFFASCPFGCEFSGATEIHSFLQSRKGWFGGKNPVLLSVACPFCVLLFRLSCLLDTIARVYNCVILTSFEILLHSIYAQIKIRFSRLSNDRENGN